MVRSKAITTMAHALAGIAVWQAIAQQELDVSLC